MNYSEIAKIPEGINTGKWNNKYIGILTTIIDHTDPLNYSRGLYFPSTLAYRNSKFTQCIYRIAYEFQNQGRFSP